MLAQRKVLDLLGEKAVQLITDRYDGYRGALVRQLARIINTQASAPNDAKRQAEVNDQIDALAVEVGRKRGERA